MLRFDSKQLSAIVERETREANKKLVVMEKFLEGTLRDAKRSLLAQIEVLEYPWKSKVCCEGTKVSKVYIVYKGSVALMSPEVVLVKKPGSVLEKQKLVKKSKMIKTLGPDFCFGLKETRFDIPMEYDIICYQPDTILFSIDADKLWEVARKEHVFYQNLMLRIKMFSESMQKTAAASIIGKALVSSIIDNKAERELNSNKPAEAMILKISAEANETAEIRKRPCLRGRDLNSIQELFRMRDRQIKASLEGHDPTESLEIQAQRYNAADKIFFKHIRRR